MMANKYTVAWRLDVEADSVADAAEKALEALRSEKAAAVFYVRADDGDVFQVDFAADDLDDAGDMYDDDDDDGADYFDDRPDGDDVFADIADVAKAARQQLRAAFNFCRKVGKKITA